MLKSEKQVKISTNLYNFTLSKNQIYWHIELVDMLRFLFGMQKYVMFLTLVFLLPL